MLPNARAYFSRILQGELPALVLALCAIAIAGDLPAEAGSHTRAEAGPTPTEHPPARLPLIATRCCLAPSPPLSSSPLPAVRRVHRVVLPALPPACVSPRLRADRRTRRHRRCERLPRPARGILLLVAITAAGSVNVVHASREQAFNLRRYEARYRTAGRYLAAALPRNAVIVAVQQSASVRHYTGLPVVRWDLLAVDLDAAVADRCAPAAGYPVILIEDWESAALQAKFPRSRLHASTGLLAPTSATVTHVRLFDPADRDAPASAPVTDRVP